MTQLSDLPVLPLPIQWGADISEVALTETVELGARASATERKRSSIRTPSLRGLNIDVFWSVDRAIFPDDIHQFFDDLQGAPFRIDPDNSGEPLPIAWHCASYSIDYSGPDIWNFKADCVEVSAYELLSLSDSVELFEISNWNIDDPFETIYICGVEGGVSFMDQVYEGLPIQAEGFDLVGKGTPPSPKVVVSNLGGFVSEWLSQAKGDGYRLEGATVTRRLTQRCNLDGEIGETDEIRERPFHSFVIEQVSENKHQCEFVLIDPLSRDGVSLPNRIAGRRCTWQYRSIECGYSGARRWNLNNQPVLSARDDKCSKTVTACQLRFGGDLPHGGFPGMQNF